MILYLHMHNGEIEEFHNIHNLSIKEGCLQFAQPVENGILATGIPLGNFNYYQVFNEVKRKVTRR